jgi:RNA polymerase sigma factor (sigma-70 family)
LLPFHSRNVYIVKMNDIELLQAFSGSRSEQAFSELVCRYAGLVYSTAKRRLANPSLAEDITQMVFIRFAKNPPRVKTPAELAAWLHRTTVNVSIDLWRSETRRRARELEAAVMETPATDPRIWEEVSLKLDEALNQLNDEDRQALLLRFFSRKTMHEVGATLGVSEDAAKMRVSRAVDRLRTQMGATATACTVALFSTLLLERSAEAVPAQLIARLSAIKFSTAAGLAGTGGLIAALFRILNFKLALGTATLVLLAVTALHFAQSPKTSSANTSVINSQTNATDRQTATANPKQPDFITGNSGGPAPAPAKVRMLFRVLDAKTGQPLVGAKIRAAMFGIGGEGEGHDLSTGNDGIAAIPYPKDPVRNHGMNVFVAAEKHVPKAVGFGADSTTTNYTIKLDPAVTIGGIVIDEQNQPVSGVKILIQGPGIVHGQHENVDFQICSMMSTNDGTWSCSYIPYDYTNEIRLILQKKGFAATFPVVPVAKVDLNNLVLMINRGFKVTGQIADSEGQPIIGATIKTVTGDPAKRQSARTDENGVFTLTDVPGDSDTFEFPSLETNGDGETVIRGLAAEGSLHLDLAIQAAGFTPQTATVNLSAKTNIANFTLSLSKILRGHVVDEMGRPIPNAIVQTDWNNQGLRDFDWQTRTDVDGQFEWDSAPPGPILYWIEADGYVVQREVPLVADTSDHEIVLEKATP